MIQLPQSGHEAVRNLLEGSGFFSSNMTSLIGVPAMNVLVTMSVGITGQQSPATLEPDCYDGIIVMLRESTRSLLG